MREPFTYSHNIDYIQHIKEKISKQTCVVGNRTDMELTERWFVEQRNHQLIMEQINNLKTINIFMSLSSQCCSTTQVILR